MGREKPGIRDGTGSYKDSYQKSISDKGRRQERGEKCPVLKEEDEFSFW